MKLTLENLKDRIEAITGVSTDTKSRKREIVYAKKLFCYIARKKGHTFESIGRVINYDHATVIFHCTDAEWLLKNDPDFYNKYLRIVGLPKEGNHTRDYMDLLIGKYAIYN